VDLIITEKCVFEVDPEKGLTLTEVADGYTPDDIVKHTGCHINVNTEICFFYYWKLFNVLFFRFLILSDQCNKYKLIENK